VNAVTLGNLELDRDRYDARIAGQRVELTFTEFTLLDKLVQNAGRVVLQEELLAAVWGDASPKLSGRLRVQMSRLRKKLEGSKPWAIRTVQKRGYALTDLSEDAGHSNGRLGRRPPTSLEPSRGGQAW
jgi:DNA-binding response OmpR family regulator